VCEANSKSSQSSDSDTSASSSPRMKREFSLSSPGGEPTTTALNGSDSAPDQPGADKLGSKKKRRGKKGCAIPGGGGGGGGGAPQTSLNSCQPGDDSIVWFLIGPNPNPKDLTLTLLGDVSIVLDPNPNPNPNPHQAYTASSNSTRTPPPCWLLPSYSLPCSSTSPHRLIPHQTTSYRHPP